MNFMRKISGSEDDQKEEKQQEQTPTIGPLLSSSYHHHHPHHHQSFFTPSSYGQYHNSWLQDGGEPSSNNQDEGGWNMVVEREHMFDKVVTPSDVGKLNRLVIPKQHAERFFPLDSSTNYKGLLLNFEDRNGKLWRFQYSYWNSSQSYVMTKGWSRFVKEKKLEAGDIVSFQRGVGVTGKDRLFIDWRRRVNPSTPSHQLSSSSPHDLSYLLHNNNFIHPWNPMVLQSFPARRNPNYFMLQDPNTNVNPNHSGSRSVYFGSGGYGPSHQQLKMVQRSELGLGLGFDAAPPATGSMVDHGKGSGKRLRLFGVNMDCVFSDDEDDDHSSELMENTAVGGCSTVVNPLIPSSSSSSSSFSTIPYLQLTPNGGESECNQSTMLSSSSSTTHDFSMVSRSTVSNMCLDLKMSQTDE